MSVRAASPSKRKSEGPWLTGTFTTPKGRTLTGEELCHSLDRMYNAFADRKDESGANKKAPGPEPKVKLVTSDELEAITTRLYQTKESALPKGGKLECKQLAYLGTKEVWEPVKKKPEAENTEYLCSLYQRCINSKKEAEQRLADKWLKPIR